MILQARRVDNRLEPILAQKNLNSSILIGRRLGSVASPVYYVNTMGSVTGPRSPISEIPGSSLFSHPQKGAPEEGTRRFPPKRT
eukprot:6197077-Pleurochrysis_carterae.AAC.4